MSRVKESVFVCSESNPLTISMLDGNLRKSYFPWALKAEMKIFYEPCRVMELQAMLFGLIETFEFRLPLGGLDIQRIPSTLMFPMVRGRPEEGIQLPLNVTQRQRSEAT
jgi:hypothetical protein